MFLLCSVGLGAWPAVFGGLHGHGGRRGLPGRGRVRGGALLLSAARYTSTSHNVLSVSSLLAITSGFFFTLFLCILRPSSTFLKR